MGKGFGSPYDATRHRSLYGKRQRNAGKVLIASVIAETTDAAYDDDSVDVVDG